MVEDQFPIALNSDIEVKKDEYKGAQLDEKTGKLTWEVPLAANASKGLA